MIALLCDAVACLGSHKDKGRVKLSHPLVYHATMWWLNRLHMTPFLHLSQRGKWPSAP